jgi:hypothetical protein
MQLPHIPLHFTSPEQYSEIHLLHLEDEVKAELRQGLQRADNNGRDALPVSDLQLSRNLFAESDKATDLDFYEFRATLSCRFHRGSSKLLTHLMPKDVLLLFKQKHSSGWLVGKRNCECWLQ